MEDTLQKNNRRLGEHKGNGKHSEHHAQSDAGKEKGKGGHCLEKQEGIGRTVPRWETNTKVWKTLDLCWDDLNAT